MALILSIVVPVYNVRIYLDKCVSSLLRQDLEKEEYEIILVDDGSTDGGGELCDAIADRESNVRVIHQANQGLSGARNTGMGAAKGKYIQFVDSDDYLAENVLGTLARRMEEVDLEVLRFGFQRVDEGERPIVDSREKNLEPTMDEIMDGPSFLIRYLWFSCYAWQFMLQRSFLEKNALSFKPGILFEDTEWTPRVMQKARRVSSIDQIVYYYLLRSGSITTGANKKKRIASLLSRIDDLNNQMLYLDDKRWYRGMISHLVVGIITSVSLSHYNERKEYLDILKAKGVYPLSGFLATKKAKKKIRLINLSPRLACYLIHVLNRQR